MQTSNDPKVKSVGIQPYRINTDGPESDGTLTWTHTDIIVAQITAGSAEGLGWSYASRASAVMAEDILTPAIVGRSAISVESNWEEMSRLLRNAGRGGAGFMAVAAIDIALWDLKAKLLGTSMVDLFGKVREAVPIYGSGGFKS